MTLPEGHEHAGVHFGLLRAWAVDDETGDWWGMCTYNTGPGMQCLNWIHADHLRPSRPDALDTTGVPLTPTSPELGGDTGPSLRQC